MIRTYRFIKFVIWFMAVCIILQLMHAAVSSRSFASVFETKMLIADAAIAAVLGYFLPLRRKRFKKAAAQ